jgi:hypothetical protein
MLVKINALITRTSQAARVRSGRRVITGAHYGFRIGKTLPSRVMTGMRAAVWLASLVLASACASGTASTPTPSPGQSAVAPSPEPPVSPAPVQRQETSLPAPIEEAAAASANGKLYVMGGFNAAGASLDSVYVFDGATWQTGPRLPLPVDHPSAAAVDGDVYLDGGHSNGRDSARLFRLAGDHWAELAPMHFARGGHALIADGGKLYAIGGNNSQINVPAAEVYDPTTNAWTVLPNLPSPRNHVSGFLVGGSVCVAGGRYPTTSRADCFDTAHSTWSRLADLPKATSGAGAVTFVGGAVVMAGGQDATETFIVDQLTRYTTSGWTAGDRMMIPRHGFELALFGGRAWACGGGTAPGLRPVAVCTSIADPGATIRGR